MKIADLIATIQAADPDGDLQPGVVAAIGDLAQRLEALLPDRATFDLVAVRVGLRARADGSVLLAWSSLAWGAFDARGLAALHKAVRPLVPEGDPYTAEEMAREGAHAQLADVKGRPDQVLEHERRLGAMVVHNALAAKIG